MAGEGIWKSINNGDFEEGDVWSVIRQTEHNKTLTRSFSDKQTLFTRSLPSAAKMIPTTNYENNSREEKTKQQSLPVSIPDWSKLREKKSNKSFKVHDFEDEEEEEEDESVFNVDIDDEEKLPPHEIIAKRNAKSQISSFSVFEGVGRTLKGRDLSLVRNAVLTKTGFLETGF